VIGLDSYLQLVHLRAEWLMLVLLVAFIVGEWAARLTRVEALLARGRRLVATLGRKLDRENRGVATLVYRGIVACILLLLPTIAVTALLATKLELVALVALVAWFGRSFATHDGWALWRRAKADHTPLQLAHLNYIFPDGHAVLRYSVTTRAERFAVGVVGAGVWYVAGGLVAMGVYLALATARDQFHGNAFGWAARSAFWLLDILPRFVARALFVLAGLFTPACHPFKAVFARDWLTFVARLLGVALGGPTPSGETPWVGEGTARLTHAHLRQALVLHSVAALWLMLVLSAPTIYKIIIIFI
jgi:hypothetical protein